jgi:type II secretory pathway pseudopilin PulG
LLELLLVIGVAALLLIGGIATYRLVSDGNRATESTRLLLTLRQETSNMAQQQGGNYTGVVSTALFRQASPLVTGGVLRDNSVTPFNGNDHDRARH